MHEWPVKVSVNGQPTEATVEPRLTLADYLRETCGLKGTHLGCEHGACGACTVLLDGARAHVAEGRRDHPGAPAAARIASTIGW